MTKMTNTEKKVSHKIILKPCITEKSHRFSESKRPQYVFKVDKKSNKKQIAQAIKQTFNVEVDAINTVKVPGKKKYFRGRLGQRRDEKKAYITLKENFVINIESDVKPQENA